MPDEREFLEEETDAESTAQRRRGVLRTVGLWVWILVQVTGWVLGLAVAALWIAEASGVINYQLERELARRLGPTAGPLSIEATEIRWLERTVRLRNVHLGEASEVSIERIDGRVAWSLQHGPSIEALELVDGSVRISPALTDGIRSWAASHPAPDGIPDLPAVVVRNLSLRIATPGRGDLELGRIDAGLSGAEGERPRIAGRLLPPARGGPQAGWIHLAGEWGEDDVLTLEASSRDLSLATDILPPGTPLDPLRVASLGPRGTLDLRAHARYAIGRSVFPDLEVELALREASIGLPGRAQRLEEVHGELAASFHPSPEQDPWNREAWDASAHGSARLGSVAAEGWGRMGSATPAGVLAEGWLRADGVEVEAARALLGPSSPLEHSIVPMLEPGGRFDLHAALRVPADWTPDTPAPGSLVSAVLISADGHGSVAYHGEPGPDGLRNLGFPLRVDRVAGDVLYVFDPGLSPPEHIGLIDLRGTSGAGMARTSGTIEATPRWFLPPEAPAWMASRALFLRIAGEDLAVDEDLRSAFLGLAGVIPPEELWDLYRPSGGSLSFDLDLWAGDSAPSLGTRLELDLSGVGFEWTAWPFPVRAERGRLELLRDGRALEAGGSRSGFVVALDGTSPVAQGPVSVRGHVQSDPVLTGDTGAKHFTVTAERVNLRHPVLASVASEHVPGMASALAWTGATGFVDVVTRYAHARSDEPATTCTIVTPNGDGVQVLPGAFPMPTRHVAGRMTVLIEEPVGNGSTAEPPVVTLVEPVVGRWGTDEAPIPVALRARRTDAGPLQLELFGAGIDTTNRALLGSIATVLTEPGDDAVMDLAGLGLEGLLDFSADLDLDVEAAEVLDGELRFQIRRGRLGGEGLPTLEDIEGGLVYREGVLAGEELRATVAGTPVELRDFRLERGVETTRMRARITARGFPLDAEHLSAFFDDETLGTLVEEFDWRGRIDIEDGELSIERRDVGGSSLDFRGAVEISDMFVRIGLPISVRSADPVELALSFDGGELRGWARIRELYGQVAGRRLDDASMLVSYVEPHLAIEEFRGRIEGGALTSLGLEASGGAGFFAIDLEAPFPFWLSGRVDGVDIGALTVGVFKSDFANQGSLSGSVRLSGRVDDLHSIEGSGYGELLDSSLWSIPVFQALFSQLGFDTAATFDDMRCHFTIGAGAMQMTNMLLHSDLLSLTGTGRLGFDGSLHHDLEVRYALVDKLGPLTLLFYRIQNSLLRVAVRGDMSRPKVVLRGIISQFFRSVDTETELPLPGHSELPARF